MNAEFVMRSVAIMACATTLSLFTTIAAYAAVGVVTIRYEGGLGAYSSALSTTSKPLKIAKAHVRAS